ncbi:hypothetical protein AB5R33_000520 [Proteus mirabilis]
MKTIKLTKSLLNRLLIKHVGMLFIKTGISYAKNRFFIEPDEIPFINRQLGHAEYFSLESIWNALETGKNKFFMGDECEVNYILYCFCDHLGIEYTGIRHFVLGDAHFYFVRQEDLNKPLFGGLAGDVYYAIPQQPSDIEAYLIDSLSCHTRYYVTKYQGSHNK